MRQQRGGDDEDDQQHQHHVDQRRGVDLAIGAWAPEVLKLPIAMIRRLPRRHARALMDLSTIGHKRLADGKEGVQIVRKGVQVGHDHAIGARKSVVGEHRWQCHRQTGGRHDQRFADRPGDFSSAACPLKPIATSAW